MDLFVIQWLKEVKDALFKMVCVDGIRASDFYPCC